jgi:hypothetical protein
MSKLVRLKALSLKQPWANLIVSGEKTIETRVWGTPFRGRVLLISSKQPKIEPAGFALALADLIDCRPMTKCDEVAARCEIYPKAVAWVFANVSAIEPFPMKGQLGLFDVEIPENQLVARRPPRQQSLFE